MKLTATQFQWLQWVDRHGGKAYPDGLKLRAGNDHSNTGAAISFVNLVAKGALTGRDGYLEITDYGRRLLTP
jgi:hypothetical protein